MHYREREKISAMLARLQARSTSMCVTNSHCCICVTSGQTWDERSHPENQLTGTDVHFVCPPRSRANVEKTVARGGAHSLIKAPAAPTQCRFFRALWSLLPNTACSESSSALIESSLTHTSIVHDSPPAKPPHDVPSPRCNRFELTLP